MARRSTCTAFGGFAVIFIVVGAVIAVIHRRPGTVPEPSTIVQPSEPRVVEQSHDFATILADAETVLEKTFVVKTEDGRPFELGRIVNPKPCCIDVEFEPAEEASDKRARATLSFQVGKNKGRKSWYALLKPADSALPVQRLTGRVRILQRAYFEAVGGEQCPRLRTAEGAKLEALLTVHRRRDESLGVPAVTASSERLQVEIGEANAESLDDNQLVREERTIGVHILPGAEAGIHEEAVAVDWASLGRSFRLPVRWEVKAPVEARPPAVLWRVGDTDRTVIVKLTSPDDEPVIQSVSGPDGCRVERIGDRQLAVTPATVALVRPADGTLAAVEIVTNLGTLSVPIFDARKGNELSASPATKGSKP